MNAHHPQRKWAQPGQAEPIKSGIWKRLDDNRSPNPKDRQCQAGSFTPERRGVIEAGRICAFAKDLRREGPLKKSVCKDLALALAMVLLRGKPATLRISDKPVEWRGLADASLRRLIRRAGLGPMNFAERSAIITEAEEFFDDHARIMSPEEFGQLIGLTRETRQRLKLWSFEAVDETAEQRRARKADERKARDREAKRSKRRSTPREKSAARTKPWDALKISRPTYYRRLKRPAGETHGETSCRPTYRAKTPYNHGEGDKRSQPIPVEDPGAERPVETNGRRWRGCATRAAEGCVNRSASAKPANDNGAGKAPSYPTETPREGQPGRRHFAREYIPGARP
jgi:hypothetical protein